MWNHHQRMHWISFSLSLQPSWWFRKEQSHKTWKNAPTSCKISKALCLKLNNKKNPHRIIIGLRKNDFRKLLWIMIQHSILRGFATNIELSTLKWCQHCEEQTKRPYHDFRLKVNFVRKCYKSENVNHLVTFCLVNSNRCRSLLFIIFNQNFRTTVVTDPPEEPIKTALW